MIAIKYSLGTCLECGKIKLITNKRKHLCMYCNSKILMKKSLDRKKEKISKGLIVDPAKMSTFYKEFMVANQPHVSYETGDAITNCRPWNIHHLLEKKDYPNLALNHDVCIYLTLAEHSTWHQLSNKSRQEQFPNSYAKYLQLKEKYNL